jgi:hypothetical protein
LRARPIGAMVADMRKGIIALTASILTLFPIAEVKDSAAATEVKIIKKIEDLRPRWTPRASRSYARKQLSGYGWSPTQWKCLNTLWTRESNWRHKAYNKTPVRTSTGLKHAGGIPQILGMNPRTPVPRQIQKGLDYIDERYGSPCGALSHWDRKHWY